MDVLQYQNTCFYEHLWTAASVLYSVQRCAPSFPIEFVKDLGRRTLLVVAVTDIDAYPFVTG